MKLHSIDLLILCVYLLSTVAIGWVMRQRARRSQSDYMLGDESPCQQ